MKISKEEFAKMMTEHKVRGGGMKLYADFILKEKGEEGLKKLEDVMAGSWASY